MNDECLLTDRWEALPQAQRAEVLALLGRLIARGVIADEVIAVGAEGTTW